MLMAILEQRIKRSDGTVANQKRKSGEKKRRELETEAGGYGGVWGTEAKEEEMERRTEANS